MLATLLMVHHNDGELPKGRSRLYARYIDGMLGIWDDRQEVQVDVSGLDREQKKRVLTSLAVSIHMENQDELDESDALRLISLSLQDYGYHANAQFVLDSLRERSGLIIGPGSYSFSHKSIGEYLVSQAICDGDRIVKGEKLDRFVLHHERSNDRWLNILYFWAGSAPVAEVKSFIEALNHVEDLALWLGLLWDQMDRFQTDWMSQQMREALSIADKMTLTPQAPKFHYFGWSFTTVSKGSQKLVAEGLLLRARHVSISHLNGKPIQALLSAANYGLEEMENLQSQGCYNLVFNFILDSLPNNVARLNTIALNNRWPEWLKKSQFALILLDDGNDTTVSEKAALWEKHFNDSVELWVTGGWVNRISFQDIDGTDSLRYCSILLEFLNRQWSNDALQLSRIYHQSNPYKKKEELQSVDLFKLLLKVLNEMKSDDSIMQEMLGSIKMALLKLRKQRK